jgi:phospholipase C
VPSSPAATPTVAPSSGHAIKTVFIILMENENWASITDKTAAPYINGTLLPMASYATRYYNPPGMHPSLPDYLWLEAGTNFGITDDAPPSSHALNTTSHLTTLLKNAGISWKAYQEGISGSNCPRTDSYPYVVHHDPFVYFDDVTNNQSSSSSYCTAHVVPYTKLATDLDANTVARYNFIKPDVCHDMHDSCGGNPITQGDTWLRDSVPAILSSQAYKNGGALFITWDEGGGGSDGPIGMIVVSPYAKGGGYSNAIHYTHSSTLRTLEEIFGVSPLLGDAAHATDLSDLFRTFP